jgi:hypothetical protein
MMQRRPTLTRTIGAVALASAAVLLVQTSSETRQAAPSPTLRSALTFHASFDGKVAAVHADGDPSVYWAPSMKERQAAQPGLPPTGETQHAAGAGRFGDALRFTKRTAPLVFFRAQRNMPYATADWNGTVSFWLRVDPRGELEPGFCDPVQITPRAWNDAAFFVEFEKRPESTPFRLGVYANLDVWNPTKRKFEEIPASERPLVTVDDPPFAATRWTHVVFTFERFNTGKGNGVARLYLDGEPRGVLSARQQTFTWDPAQAIVGLGLNYIGLLDELSIFNRALAADEVAALSRLPSGVPGLLR